MQKNKLPLIGGQKERIAKRKFHKSYAQKARYTKVTIVNLAFA